MGALCLRLGVLMQGGGLVKAGGLTDEIQYLEYHRYDCIEAVSYTHLTLPTKRIV